MTTEDKLILAGSILCLVASLALSPNVFASSQEKPEQTQIYVKEQRELESGFYRDDGYPIDTKLRPAINPDFDPDESCDLKWELKCIPGSEQKCRDLEGYDNGEMNVCTPKSCPEGYHNISEDEDNICHSNKIDCPNNFVLAKGVYGDMCKEPRNDTHTSNSNEGPESYATSNNEMWCDGKSHDYEGVSDLPKLDEGKCYGTCEQMSKGLACDIENRK